MEMPAAAIRPSPIPRLLLAIAAALVAPAAAASDTNPWDGEWHPSITAYGWLPGVTSDLRFRVGDDEVENESDGNILDNLSAAFMLEGELRKGDWGIYGDFDWVKFDKEEGHLSRIGGENVGADVSLDTQWGLKGGMFTLAGLYTLRHGANGYTDLIFGGRYLWLKGELSWDFDVTGNGGLVDIDDQGEARRNMHVTTAIVGLKGRWIINEGRFFVPYYVDVGYGSSDSTAQAAAGVGYAFDWGDMAFVWRHVRYKHDDDEASLRRLDIDGPSLNLSWQF